MASKDLVSWILHQIAHRASCSFIILPPPKKKNQYDATQWLPSFTELLRRLGGSGRRKTMCTDLSHWIRVSIHEVHVPVAQKKKTNPVTVGPVELVGTQWSGTRRRQDAARDCRRRRRVILHFVDEWKRNGMNPQRNADDTRRTNPVAREN